MVGAPRAGLVDYCIGLGRWACPIGSLANEAGASDPLLAAVISDSFMQWRELLAAGVDRLRAGGDVHDATDSRRVAAAILSAIQGGLLLSQVERDPWPLEAALDRALHALKGDRRPL